MRTLKFPGSTLSSKTTFAPSHQVSSAPGDLVDNWELLVNDNFEGTFPITSTCTVWDFSADGFDRKWGKDSVRATSPAHSIWPARDGAQGMDPATNNYPANMDTWLKCGPYDFTNAKFLMARYNRWLDIPDLDEGDFQFIGASIDGNYFNGVFWYGVGQYWVDETAWLEGYEGLPQVWIALVFRSDSDATTGKGAWIDDFKMWRYNNRSVTCANLDPGNKAVNIGAYDKIEGVNYPIIRAGDVQVVQGLMTAGAHWVRLPILQNNTVFIDDQAYDRMIDTLCNAGIGVMPLFDHESISRSVLDANNDATAASYRTDFANRANWLASHFKGRVKYWQVWNEPVDVVPLSDSRYAALLTQTANSIKLADPNAKIVAAGLEHAWNAQEDYFRRVYLRLDQEQNGARPFDVFAIHPYNDNPQYSLDPTGYMHQAAEMNVTLGDRTIVDKFVRRMEANGDTGKKVWVSEVGWNSALGAPNARWPVVDEITQARYLKPGFDILFNEARSVNKIFWYKYMDEIVDQPNRPTLLGTQASEESRIRHPELEVFDPSSPHVLRPGFWGLYRTTKLDAKPSRCAFLYYPQRCPDLPWFTYLPLILRGQ